MDKLTKKHEKRRKAKKLKKRGEKEVTSGLGRLASGLEMQKKIASGL